MKAAIALSALSGWLALSYEIVWYRMISFTSRGTASGFAYLLAWYLFGLAAGALAARKAFPEGGRLYRPLARYVLLASVAGFFTLPAFSWLVTTDVLKWPAALPLVAVAAAGLGTVFPLLAEAAVAADERVGQGISRLYVANIAGSVAGTLLTGFVLMDVLSIRATSLCLGVGGAAIAGGVAWLAKPGLRSLLPALASAGALAAAAPALFDGLYERLQMKRDYRASFRFSHVVETKSGVITVDPDGTVYGGGIYDGMYNVDPTKPGNDIVRAYALPAIHPSPRRVLQIGLSTGSWARVIADLPEVERLTVVEINPGYLRLLPLYPPVAALPSHPKAKIEIDDGRRWLVRHEETFDVIIANVWNWRAGASNLLSAEFMELVRSRLRPGGRFYFNTTGSPRVIKTALDAFPHVIRVRNYLVASDAPIAFDAEAARRAVLRAPGLDPSDPRVAAAVKSLTVEDRASLERGVGAARGISDDNMGTEWTDVPPE